jgi:hypothetical protein
MQFVAEVGAATERSVAYVGGLAQLFGKSCACCSSRR